MAVHNRPFDPAKNDFEKMWRFLQQDYADKQERFIWLFCRLGAWKYGLWREKKYIPTFFRDHAQLWVDGFDQLLGFVISEDGDDIFFIFTLQGYEYLYADILDWTIEHWGPRYGKLKAEVHEYQDDVLAKLEDSGFQRSDVVAHTRTYDLVVKAQEAVTLPPGFQIVDMRENGDHHGKALLLKNGFSNEDHVTEFELLRFAYSRENPAYDPAFDFSAVTTDGNHAATCVGFNDPAHGVAEVEVVCTHNQYRRQGLGEAVIRACFHRLADCGIPHAYITGYSVEANGLYEKLGPCGHKQWFHYELAM